MSLRRMMMAVAGVNATALSIYNKLTSGGDWFKLDSAGSTITGAHNSTTATKLGSGGTSAVSGGVDFTPNALYRVETADLPFTPAANAQVTMCGWVKADSIANVCPFILGSGAQSSGYLKALQAFFISSGVAKARVGKASDNTIQDADTPSSTVATGVNYFLQVQRTATKVRVRVNNGTWYEATITGDPDISNCVFSIGGDYLTTSPANTYQNMWDGIVGDVLIHSSTSGTLSDAELNYLYNGGTRLTYETLKAAAGITG